MAHASYTMNLCSAKPETRANALDMLKQDLQNLPFILETPNDDAGYKEEIAIVNSWM